MYAMGQIATVAPVMPGFRPLETPAVLSTFFQQREAAGTRYRGVAPNYVFPMKAAMVGWKVRSGPTGHDPIDTSVTEVAELTPYVEATGPTDPGDGYRWVENRTLSGRGIIMIPPPGWQPSDDLMRAKTGTVRLIATEQAAELVNAPPQGPGFVLAEPAGGWRGAAISKGEKLPSWVLPAGIGVAVVAIGVLAYVGMRRR